MFALSGDWLTRSVVHAPEVARLCSNAAIRRVAFDASRLGRSDTMLVAFLWDIKRAATASGLVFDDSGLPPSAPELITLLPTTPAQPRTPGAAVGTDERVARFERSLLERLASEIDISSLHQGPSNCPISAPSSGAR